MISALNPVANVRAFTEFYQVLRRYRALIAEMARRDLFEPYAGQMFGAFWTFLHPLAMMGVYVFVFNTVFRVRIGGTVDLPLDYTTYLLSGLIPWLGIVTSLSKGAYSLLQHSNLVKQVVFPIEILPVKSTLSAMVPQIFGLMILLAYVGVTHGIPPATYLLLPVVLVLQFMFMLGVAFFLSAITCFVRDMKDVIQVLVIAGVYLLPVFYLPAWVPGLFKPLLYANPFSYIIWAYQDILYFGRFEHPYTWIVFPVLSVVMLVLGYRMFRRLRPYVGGVL